jgi:hypothetical protein
LLYDDLYKLKDLVAEHFPKNLKGHKTALVTETGFIAGLAETYAGIAKELDVEVRVFSDLNSAKEWIKTA